MKNWAELYIDYERLVKSQATSEWEYKQMVLDFLSLIASMGISILFQLENKNK